MSDMSKVFNRLTTLEEVLDYVSHPDLLEQRVGRLKECAAIFPALKTFLALSFSTLGEYEYLCPIAAQKPVSKTPNRQEIGFQEFFVRYLPAVGMSKPGSLANKRAKLMGILDFLEPRDFALIVPALEGKFAYKNEKVNSLVLSLAFPETFPNV